MNQHYQMLRAVSRTFALSIEQLPQPLRDSLTASYLLLRVSDCLEDEGVMTAERREELLRLWAAVLQAEAPVSSLTGRLIDLDNSNPEVYVAQNAEVVLRALDALPGNYRTAVYDHVIASTLGMARWQAHGPFVEDEDALDDYMFEVAGRVGYLITDLFSHYSPRIAERKAELMPLSRHCGLALQTVNVIRGMRKDYERGWVFVPITFYEEAGLTRETLFDAQHLDKSLVVVARLADKAERHLRLGLTYVTAFPRHLHSIRLSVMWPLLFAARTLAISRNNANVLLHEAKIGRQQVKQIIYRTKLFGWSNHFFNFYCNHLAQTPTYPTPESPLLTPTP